jgi:hypothetical protein
VRPTSRLSRFAPPQPHARPAAVFGDKLDAGRFKGATTYARLPITAARRFSPLAPVGIWFSFKLIKNPFSFVDEPFLFV